MELRSGCGFKARWREQDDFRLVYAQGRYALAESWSLEGGLAGIDYRKAVQSNAGTILNRK
jgi:hypothetical protein